MIIKIKNDHNPITQTILIFKLLKLIKNIPPFLRNKFFITSFIFIIWISFFDHYNFFFHAQLVDQKEELENELLRLKRETERNKIFLRNTNNKEFMEKFAREHYLMKKDGEDIFMLD